MLYMLNLYLAWKLSISPKSEELAQIATANEERKRLLEERTRFWSPKESKQPARCVVPVGVAIMTTITPPH